MNPTEEQHDISIDALRHAVRTIPTTSWTLYDAKAVMRHCSDFRRIWIRNGLYSLRGIQDQLDRLVAEGWLCRPDGVHYVPTEAARGTWPRQSA
jgi:hypothetical protein